VPLRAQSPLHFIAIIQWIISWHFHCYISNNLYLQEKRRLKDMKEKRISVTLGVLVDLKVGDRANVKNLIERLECTCINAGGEDAKIIQTKIIDRKLLVEGEDDEID
jgi:hypothetical protein